MKIRISIRTFFVLFIALVSCLLLLRQVHISADSFKFKEVKRGDHINVNYDNRSGDSALSDINKHLRVWLDGHVILDIIDPNFDYDISEIAVGSGYSRTRPFDGELTNFRIKYKLFEENKNAHLTIISIKIFLILCIGVISLLILLGINQSIREYIKVTKKKAVLALSIVLIVDVMVLTSLIIYNNAFQYKKIGSSKYANIHYDNRSNDRKLAEVKKYQESRRSDAMDM